MSIARLCDICGAPMKDKGDRNYYDLAILKGESPLLEGEDVCDKCMANFEATLQRFIDGKGEVLIKNQITVSADYANKMRHSTEGEKKAYEDMLAKKSVELQTVEQKTPESDNSMLPLDELKPEHNEIAANVAEANEPQRNEQPIEKVEPPKPKETLREGVVKSTVFKMPETRGRAHGSLLG